VPSVLQKDNNAMLSLPSVSHNKKSKAP